VIGIGNYYYSQLPRLCGLLLILGFLWQPVSVQAVDRSSSLYAEVQQSIYQVRIINRKTGHKRTIGSGFVIERPNLLVTNYHVVSAYINDPDNYSMEYLATNGATGLLELIDVDVLHDLALLAADKSLGKPLKTAALPEKGVTLYAFGNPLGLGFSVVTGTNNGLLTESEDKNILFSGNLNSGMSGGPALNEQGAVVGVNVATAGNAVSFLVASEYLNDLLAQLRLTDFKPRPNLHESIVRQLNFSTTEMLQRMRSNPWKLVSVGSFKVPSRLDNTISCWDGSENNEDHGLVNVISVNCSNEREIYLDDKLSVGNIQYQYTWYDSDKMIPPRFYRMYEAQNMDETDNKTTKENVSAFKCSTNFLTIASQIFKMTICRRDYIRYQGLSDVLVTGAMVSQKQQGFLFELFITGVDFKESISLVKKIFESFQWQN